MPELLWEDVRNIKTATEGDRMCGQYGPNNSAFVCTRELRHSGPHIAHTAPDWVVAGWRDGDTKVTNF